jgi:hypothetical protein
MGSYEFTISLRIRHPNIAPAEITRNLGIEPVHFWRAGDPQRNTAGVEIGGTHRESYWMSRLMAKPELAADRVSVESEVLRTLAQLRRAFGFLVTLKAEGGVADLHINIFAREEFHVELLPETLSLLGRLGLTVAIEVKPSSLDPGVAPPPAAAN